MNLNIKRSHWLLLSLLAVLSIGLWVMLSLPRYETINLSIKRPKAIEIARTFLNQKLGINLQGYQLASIFAMDGSADRYLQKTLGIDQEKKFLKDHNYDLFYWKVRFFKEGQKEELRVIVSSKTGEVIGFSHDIEETASRPAVDVEAARQMAIDFVSRQYSFDNYLSHDQHIDKRENRTDYKFVWEVKNVDIPWGRVGGSAKILMTVGVTGQEILYFDKGQLSIPEAFNRYIDNLKQTGENLMLIAHLFFMGLLTLAIMLLVNRKKYVVLRMTKNFYAWAGGFLFIFIIFDVLNSYQTLIFHYPTTQLFGEYISRNFVGVCISVVFTVFIFIIPGLTGEALRYEVSPQDKFKSFLSPVLSSFFTVPMAQQIWIGYLIAPIYVAIQSILFLLGYQFAGVWDEKSWFIQSSTAMIPALTAFVFGFHASVSEEIMFRLFAIHLLKRYGLGTVLAVVISALMWGLGHTGYEVFPMWFRGVEVTVLGITIGFVYLRFGLMTVIVAHFLVDVFRYSLQYLINPTLSFDFLSCFAVMCLPLIFSLCAYFWNRSITEKSWKPRFTSQQEFNYELLKQVCSQKNSNELIAFKEELMKHGWDPIIIERVFEEKAT
jgi:hypothetical protein